MTAFTLYNVAPEQLVPGRCTHRRQFEHALSDPFANPPRTASWHCHKLSRIAKRRYFNVKKFASVKVQCELADCKYLKTKSASQKLIWQVDCHSRDCKPSHGR